MRTSLAWIAAGVCLIVGLASGYVVGKNQGLPLATTTPNSRTSGEADVRARTRAEMETRDPTGPEPSISNRRHPFDDPSSAAPDGGDETAPSETPSANEPIPVEDEGHELERLRGEVAALHAERDELMGRPIEARADAAPRFSGDAMSAAVGAALIAEKVGGAVEATDCAEDPCIVFGRLEGDEEDMEEIERSAALSPYADDVLTLLFWATSVDRAKMPNAKLPETGLFALAFYSVEDRVRRGAALDRRIRARVMEYWNTDRPGPGE